MYTDKLTAFVAVADERSFSVAADELDITEAELRMSVQALEHDLGHRLFAHTTGTVRLTPEGEAALPAARSALTALRAVGQAADSVDGDFRGRVRFGIVVGAVVPELSKVLTEFAKTYPDIRLEISAGSATSLESRIADGSLDLAYVVHSEPSVRFRYSFTDPLVAVGGDDEAPTIGIAELASTPIVAVDAAIGVREALERAASLAGARIDVVAHVATPALALELAGDRLGRAVVAETLAPAGSPRIIDGDGHEMRLHIGLIAHPEHRSAATDHLLDVLQTEIERTYGQG